MSLIEQDLAEIDAVLLASPDGGSMTTIIAEIRRRLPGMVCMQCDASDVLEDPWRSYADIDLHLIDASSHCTLMPTDPQRASGVLLARRVPA